MKDWIIQGFFNAITIQQPHSSNEAREMINNYNLSSILSLDWALKGGGAVFGHRREGMCPEFQNTKSKLIKVKGKKEKVKKNIHYIVGRRE